MPTYEYECRDCGHNFELFQGMNEDPLSECPECGGGIRRIINGGAGVIFKGSGFYVTDKNKAAAKTGAAAAPKTEKAGAETKAGDAAGSACASCPAAAASGGSCPAEKAAG
ncbi:MAG: zinc ribbon domain-containing protein [Treponema sp.]|jgi:putative FmdB family regulatory protein|nr:zinc ribbon domain-containing protein [Treponema sp.]